MCCGYYIIRYNQTLIRKSQDLYMLVTLPNWLFNNLYWLATIFKECMLWNVFSGFLRWSVQMSKISDCRGLQRITKKWWKLSSEGQNKLQKSIDTSYNHQIWEEPLCAAWFYIRSVVDGAQHHVFVLLCFSPAQVEDICTISCSRRRWGMTDSAIFKHLVTCVWTSRQQLQRYRR